MTPPIGPHIRRAPVDKVRITPKGGYGFDRGTVRHFAWDLGGAPGTPVYAPEDMEVIQWAAGDEQAKARRLTGYGPAVILARGVSGAIHVLGHLDGWAWSGSKRAALPWGGRVYKAGERVGEISKLNHVHWEIRIVDYPPTGDARGPFTMDPAKWLAGSDPPASSEVPDPGSPGGFGAILIVLGVLLIMGDKS
jgi:murein DD-endopeptidase MepM/ murein hydrolase activator NlpD